MSFVEKCSSTVESLQAMLIEYSFGKYELAVVDKLFDAFKGSIWSITIPLKGLYRPFKVLLMDYADPLKGSIYLDPSMALKGLERETGYSFTRVP